MLQKAKETAIPTLSELFPKTLGIFSKNSRNFFPKLSEHFPKTLGTFSKNSRNFFPKLSEHFPKTLGTFSKNSRNIFQRILLLPSWLRLLQKSIVSQSCEQDCLDFAERMKRKVLRGSAEGSIPPYVTIAESRKQHSDSPLCNSLGDYLNA